MNVATAPTPGNADEGVASTTARVRAATSSGAVVMAVAGVIREDSVYAAPEMVQRPVPLTEWHAVAHRTLHIGLRRRHRILERCSLGEVCRNRRRERAARAMRIASFDARSGEF